MTREDLARSWLTITQATALVHRSRRTVERWIAAQLVEIRIHDGAGRTEHRIVVNELSLLRAERHARRNNPTSRGTNTTPDVVS